MKGTSRLAAAGVVLFTTLGLLGYLWANQLRLDVPGYGFIRPQAAELSVRLGSHLVWLDHEGREQQHLDLGQEQAQGRSVFTTRCAPCDWNSVIDKARALMMSSPLHDAARR